jgi:2-polyprenyl-3-methyl-5-hydroxy-6-metoxy-1,4-benzoquinol methylase
MLAKGTKKGMSLSQWPNNLEGIEMINIEKIFDMSANTYDKTEEKRFEPIHIKTLENTEKYLNGRDIVLDYGCGTGTKALELAGKVTKVYGIDISSKMIEVAKRKAAERRIENVDFAQATLFDESYAKESFDVILASAILHLLENRREVMQRITQLLKPGGLFISATTCLGEKMTFEMKFKFLPFLLLSKTGLVPPIKRFRFSELQDLIATGNLQIVERKKFYHQLSFYFFAAKKIERT